MALLLLLMMMVVMVVVSHKIRTYNDKLILVLTEGKTYENKISAVKEK